MEKGEPVRAQLTIRNTAGTILAQDLAQNGGGNNARLLFTPTASATYILGVAAPAGSSVNVG